MYICAYISTRFGKEVIGLLRGVKAQKRFRFTSNNGQPSHPISFKLSHTQMHMSMTRRRRRRSPQ